MKRITDRCKNITFPQLRLRTVIILTDLSPLAGGIAQWEERLPPWWKNSLFAMPVCMYVEENSSAAMLATKRSAGVTPDMNLGNV